MFKSVAIAVAVLCGVPVIVPAVGLAQTVAGHVTQVSSRASAGCTDYRLNQTALQRLQADNLQRLQAAQSLVAPGFVTHRRDGLRLLAEYQEEMERMVPNRNTAAAYLAAASTVPVTLSLVQALNTTLCVAASLATAEAVVTQAEALRIEMSR